MDHISKHPININVNSQAANVPAAPIGAQGLAPPGDVPAAFKALLDNADPRALTAAYIDARLDELAKSPPPPTFWHRLKGYVPALSILAGTVAVSIGTFAVAVLGTAWCLTQSPAYAFAAFCAFIFTAATLVTLNATVDYWNSVPEDASTPALPLAPSAQLKVVLTEATALHADLTAAVQAKNAYGFELIRHSTTRQRYELERATEEAKTAEQQARHAQFARQAQLNRQAEPLHPMAEGVMTLQAEVRERVRARIESEKPENRRAAEAGAAEHRRAQEAAEAEHHVKLAALAAQQAEYERQAQDDDEDTEPTAEERRAEEAAEAEHHVRLAALAAEEASHTQPPPAVEEPTPAQRRAEELATTQHAAALEKIEQQRRLAREMSEKGIRVLANSETASPRRKQRTELTKAQHRLEVERLRAEKATHQATTKKHATRQLTPEEQLAQRAKERVHSTMTSARVLGKTERDLALHLQRLARDHGEDSEEYRAADAFGAELLADLRDEVNDAAAPKRVAS